MQWLYSKKKSVYDGLDFKEIPLKNFRGKSLFACNLSKTNMAAEQWMVTGNKELCVLSKKMDFSKIPIEDFKNPRKINLENVDFSKTNISEEQLFVYLISKKEPVFNCHSFVWWKNKFKKVICSSGVTVEIF